MLYSVWCQHQLPTAAWKILVKPSVGTEVTDAFARWTCNWSRPVDDFDISDMWFVDRNSDEIFFFSFRSIDPTVCVVCSIRLRSLNSVETLSICSLSVRYESSVSNCDSSNDCRHRRERSSTFSETSTFDDSRHNNYLIASITGSIDNYGMFAKLWYNILYR